MQCAHIMAMAVQKIHKDALVTVGPWTDRGFFYDFDMKVCMEDEKAGQKGREGELLGLGWDSFGREFSHSHTRSLS